MFLRGEIHRVSGSTAIRSMVVSRTGPFRIATCSSRKRPPYLTRGGQPHPCRFPGPSRSSWRSRKPSCSRLSRHQTGPESTTLGVTFAASSGSRGWRVARFGAWRSRVRPRWIPPRVRSLRAIWKTSAGEPGLTSSPACESSSTGWPTLVRASTYSPVPTSA